MNWAEVLTRYFPPRYVQAIVLLLVLGFTLGFERVAKWIEALGTTAALRVLGIEMPS